MTGTETGEQPPLFYDTKNSRWTPRGRAVLLWVCVILVNVFGGAFMFSQMTSEPHPLATAQKLGVKAVQSADVQTMRVATAAQGAKETKEKAAKEAKEQASKEAKGQAAKETKEKAAVPHVIGPPEPLSKEDIETGVIVAAIATCLVAAPFITFLSHGWFARFDEFRNSLKDGALRAYLDRYWSASLKENLLDVSSKTDAENLRDRSSTDAAIFHHLYHQQFGLGPFFVPPLLILVVVTYIEAVAVSLMNTCVPGVQACHSYFFDTTPLLVVSALSGAYMFAVSDAVINIRRRSLNASDIYWYALRAFLAIPIAIFFSCVQENGHPPPTLAPTLAFAIALLPVDVLMKQIRRVGYRTVGAIPKEEEGDQLVGLSGVTSPIVVLLLAEGVFSVEQVATADPILLAIRTGLPFRLVLRFGSQSIVHRHFGDAAKGLTSIGFFDAVAIHDLVKTSVRNPDYVTICNAIKAKLETAGGSAIELAVVQKKLQQITNEEYTCMLAMICPLSEPIRA